MNMYKGKTKFTREQLIFVVEVMICSFTDIIESSFALRWEDGSLDEEYRRERKEHTHSDSYNLLIDPALWQLGWNLSILYAQLTDDGLGESDALHLTDLGATLESWATKIAKGEIGIIPVKGRVGKTNGPDTRELAEKWVASAFDGYYFKGKKQS